MKVDSVLKLRSHGADLQILELERVGSVSLLDRPVAGGLAPDVFEIGLGCGGEAIVPGLTACHAARACAP